MLQVKRHYCDGECASKIEERAGIKATATVGMRGSVRMIVRKGVGG